MMNMEDPPGRDKRSKCHHARLLVWRSDKLRIEKLGEPKMKKANDDGEEAVLSREWLIPYLVRLGRVYVPAAALGEKILILEYSSTGRVKRETPFTYTHVYPLETEQVPDGIFVTSKVGDGFLELTGRHGFPTTSHLMNFLLGLGNHVLSFRKLYKDTILFTRNGEQLRLDLL